MSDNKLMLYTFAVQLVTFGFGVYFLCLLSSLVRAHARVAAAIEELARSGRDRN
ncbi:MAG: hypothetical protein R3F20_08900 [Planctomycetota bacterium]